MLKYQVPAQTATVLRSASKFAGEPYCVRSGFDEAPDEDAVRECEGVMPIIDKIKEIEHEISRTQKNKATESHLGRLKAKLAKLRSELLDPSAGGGGGKGEGFAVARSGDARVAMIGFPSVGKSTLLSHLTGTKSEAASYEFTTLTCIPGNVHHKGTKIQLLDLPGIIEGAAHGKGRGREVIAVAKSSDLVLMVLDAGKEGAKNHRAILERELETVGLRLNQRPPDITLTTRPTGGVKFTSTVPQPRLGEDPERTVKGILQEYKMHNCDVLMREEVSTDQLIDVIEGNRKYVRCLYVYNKADTVTIEDVDRLARLPHSTVISCQLDLNVDLLLELMWEYLGLVRVYTKKKGSAPDLGDPVVLTEARGGYSVENFCAYIHSSLVQDFNYAMVWGRSAIHTPKHCGASHLLCDEDVVQVVTKSVAQQKSDARAYTERAQAAMDQYKERKKKKKLKT